MLMLTWEDYVCISSFLFVCLLAVDIDEGMFSFSSCVFVPKLPSEWDSEAKKKGETADAGQIIFNPAGFETHGGITDCNHGITSKTSFCRHEVSEVRCFQSSSSSSHFSTHQQRQGNISATHLASNITSSPS